MCSLMFLASGSLGEGVGRHDIDPRSLMKEIGQTHLFGNGKNIIYPPSTQAFPSIDPAWSPLLS